MKALLNTTTQFEQVATIVAERVAQLLCAEVFVLDQDAFVIASSNPKLIKSSFNYIYKEIAFNYLRVPLSFNTQVGEVIVCKPHNGEVISSRLVQELVELVISQTTVIDTLLNQHQLKDKFIYDLLHGFINEETTVIRYSKLLGIDLAPPRAVILISAADSISKNDFFHQIQPEKIQVEIRRWANQVIRSVVSFFHLPKDTICAYIGNGEVAVLKASDTKNLRSWANHGDIPEQCSSSWANLTALKRAARALLTYLQDETGMSLNIGIGRYHPGIRGLAQSYEDARAALSLGCRFGDRNQVHCLDGLGIAAFVGVGDEQTKIELAAYLLSPLNHEPELLVTLDTFFAEDCCLSSTANRLSIHRNTLSYRLDKVNLLTGLNPRHFDDAVQIRLALLLRKLSISARGG
ncbi:MULTISPECIES: PucR family transcriptional regulator [Fischerella]|uniref:CdaR family transcriptional regulator n=1 Tax=Fischerella muscicola CCMEE 5323 TaxID=2019572 RepID=A0A2N6K1D1_FISMU|nr:MULTISPECIES: helix-turn-helix domain-containing protein [Fischerella]MBD2433694.1 helix-turn-helix domain-containing protein [Fischerella sp. FACHB-380]PLZ88376.1 CdaR family transcriptional regulator [Fischerella muscicola CCMEE 5323]